MTKNERRKRSGEVQEAHKESKRVVAIAKEMHTVSCTMS